MGNSTLLIYHVQETNNTPQKNTTYQTVVSVAYTRNCVREEVRGDEALLDLFLLPKFAHLDLSLLLPLCLCLSFVCVSTLPQDLC
jgi:hypothetical protein